MSKKYKKFTLDDRIKYIKMLENGYSYDYIKKHYGIHHSDLSVLWLKFKEKGFSGLEKKRTIHADGAYKEVIIRDVEENCLSLFEAAVKYDVSVSTIKRWRRIARADGYEALYNIKKQGRFKDMGRPSLFLAERFRP